jgi:uncharacterized membrane protein YgaE (UPF0421/DUF939 family)
MTNKEKFILVGGYIALVVVAFMLQIHQNRELDSMKDYISSKEILRITMDKELQTMDKELQIQKDNIETIMKWNEIQAKRINKLYNKMRRTKLIADASLELGLKNKNAIGWNCLSKKYRKDKLLESKGSK